MYEHCRPLYEPAIRFLAVQSAPVRDRSSNCWMDAHRERCPQLLADKVGSTLIILLFYIDLIQKCQIAGKNVICINLDECIYKLYLDWKIIVIQNNF